MDLWANSVCVVMAMDTTSNMVEYFKKARVVSGIAPACILHH